ncbi:MAG: Pvc16 family protein [Caldilineaceae bacterium]
MRRWRKLLIQEIPIRGNEVEITFDQPKREWSARLNRPTLNLFLYDVRENVSLRNRTQRQSVEPGRREVLIQRPETRVDLHYMITAWASEVDDEHRLLTRTMLCFLRHAQLPVALMTGSFSDYDRAIHLSVAQYDHPLNPTEIWGVLDNELRPALSLQATLTLYPHTPVLVPAIRTRELRLIDMDRVARLQPAQSPTNGSTQATPEDAILSRLWTIGGVVNLGADLDDASLTLEELDRDIPLDADGRFVIGNLRTGTYTLRLAIPGQAPVTRTIEVPSEEYNVTGG